MPKIVVKREDEISYKGRTLHHVKVAYGVKIDTTEEAGGGSFSHSEAAQMLA